MNQSTQDRAIALLRTAAKEDPRGIEGVAGKLHYMKKGGRGKSAFRKAYGRSYVSQYINGLNKSPMSQEFMDVIFDQFGKGRVECPHQKKDISQGECAGNAKLTWVQVSNTGYDVLDQWRACQTCCKNPKNFKLEGVGNDTQ